MGFVGFGILGLRGFGFRVESASGKRIHGAQNLGCPTSLGL